MKEKICMFFLLGSCMLSISACGNKEISGNTRDIPVSSQTEDISMSSDAEQDKDNTQNISDSSQTKKPTKKENDDTGSELKSQTKLNELEEIISTDVENTISALRSKYEKLVTDIDTYEKYLKNTDKIEAFYAQVCTETKNLCIRMREYSINYADGIMVSDKSNDDKYKDFKDLYDCIYDDAGDDIYDEIYDDILDDIYDDFYNGILDDAYDNGASYDEWSDARSDEYDRWTDARSDVYDEWSDFRSDVYDFWSDMRSELWDDDIERAEEKILDFQKDIEKIKNKNIQNDNQTLSEEKGSNTASETSEGKDTDTNIELIDGMRPEFKEAMDSYEAFYDEYCDIMKKYAENPSDMKLLAEYADMLEKADEMTKKFDEWDDSDMNNEELKYYLDVNNRVTKKLLDIYE